MNVDRAEIDHLRGFARHGLMHLERGNLGAVREGLEDMEKRLLALIERPAEDGDGEQW